MTPPLLALFDRLTRLDDLERRAREGTLHTLLPELDAAVAALGEDPAAAALRSLRAALRIDLAFLVEHPEATFTCLYNRCSWHDAAEADAYYTLPLGALAVPAERSASSHPLHVTMARWRGEIEAHGTPWLRSLRPPEIWLHGALLEEYRGQASQYSQQVRFTEDGRVLLAHERRDRETPSPSAPRAWTSVIWDRATGCRLDGEVVLLLDDEVALDGAIRVEHSDWGQADLLDGRTGAHLGRLPLSEARSVSPVAWSRDGRLVALAGMDEDACGFVAVYDVATRAPVMDLDTDLPFWELAISPRGDRIAASTAISTFVWEIATAKQLCFSLPESANPRSLRALG